MKQFTIKHPLWALTLVVCAAVLGYAEYGAGAALVAAHSLDSALWFTPVLGLVYYQSPNTGTSLATASPNEVRKLWQMGVDMWEQTSDFFAPMEGGNNALIMENTDLTKGKGQKIHFTNTSGFYDEPHMGEELFETADDYEEILLNGYDLEVDYFRHAIRYSDRMEEVMGMRNEIASGINDELGKWLGRVKSEQLFMMFREKLPASNIVFGGAKAQNTLTSADTLSWNEIVALGTVMKSKGGLPAQVGTQNGNPLFKNVIVAPTDVLYSLELDPEYREMLRTTSDIATSKLLFDGGFTSIRGHVIKEYTPIDHDGEGAIGSPLNAKALLGNAIVSSTAPLDVTGGGNPTSAAKTKKKYFKHFPGYAFRFLVGDVVTVDSSEKYFLIVNPSNAVVDPNKCGMYAYTTGNAGNRISVTKRLAATTSGTAFGTVGSVVWDPTVNTDVHPQGALILPCNSKGQVFADVLMLGRGAALRGYGKYRNKRMADMHEGGFIQENYIVSVFGQALRQDRLGRVPAATRLRVAVQYAGVPTLTTV